MLFGVRYVSEQGARNIVKYVYKGEDRSLIYKHVLTPMNNALIEHIPLWMAPNLITVIGLGFVCASHLVMMYYCPDLQGQAPDWVYAFCAICLFIYQTLDNLDGKQARRTKSSSPLGLLFDHGCDAVNTTMSTVTFAACLQLGPSWKAMLLWFSSSCPFYLSTWEEYYTGELILPIINGPTDGLIIIICMYLLTFVAGPSFWLQTNYVASSYTNGDVLFFMCVVTGFVNSIYNFRTVKSCMSRQDSFIRALFLTVPFFTVGIISCLYSYYAADIMAAHPRILLWTSGLLFAVLCTHLMVAHLCHEDYNPFRMCLIPIGVLILHGMISFYSGRSSFQEQVQLSHEVFALSLVSYVHFVVCIILELTTILRICCFTIPPPKTLV